MKRRMLFSIIIALALTGILMCVAQFAARADEPANTLQLIGHWALAWFPFCPFTATPGIYLVTVWWERYRG